LEGEEILTDIHEGEPADPRQDGTDRAKKAGEKQKGTDDSEKGD
jgi:hypothetical protein